MKPKIEFDEISRLQSGTATLWHYGSVSMDGFLYDFTLAEMKDNNWSSFEVVWVENQPDNHVEIDRLIIEAYENELLKD